MTKTAVSARPARGMPKTAQVRAAPREKGALSAAVLKAVLEALEQFGEGRAGDAATAKAIRAGELEAPQGKSAYVFMDRLFRHWGRIGWLWQKHADAPSGRQRALLGLKLFHGASAHQVGQLLRDVTGHERLLPREANVLDTVDRKALTDARFPEHIRLECPKSLLPHLRRALGDGLEAELLHTLTPPSTALRVNTLKITRDAAQRALAAAGIEAVHGALSPSALIAPRGARITQTDALKEGLVEIQDEGSQAVALLCDARPGHQVLDLCAGAGGKTLGLAATMTNKGHLVAADIHKGRLARAKVRLKRAGAENAECVVLTPKWIKAKRGRFDRILIDAPCSGTGAWARNPDQRWSWEPEMLARLMAEQDGLLDQASDMVKPGGLIIYATCSFLLEENEDRIAAFLARNSAFRQLSAHDIWLSQNLGPWPSDGHDALKLKPSRHNTDGFFACVMQKERLA